MSWIFPTSNSIRSRVTETDINPIYNWLFPGKSFCVYILMKKKTVHDDKWLVRHLNKRWETCKPEWFDIMEKNLFDLLSVTKCRPGFQNTSSRIPVISLAYSWECTYFVLLKDYGQQGGKKPEDNSIGEMYEKRK